MAPSHYLNQWWNIDNWTLGNKLQWNLNWNLYNFIQETTFENVIWKMAAILSGLQNSMPLIAMAANQVGATRLPAPGWLATWNLNSQKFKIKCWCVNYRKYILQRHFKMLFFFFSTENVCILIKMSFKFVPIGIDHMSALMIPMCIGYKYWASLVWTTWTPMSTVPKKAVKTLITHSPLCTNQAKLSLYFNLFCLNV